VGHEYTDPGEHYIPFDWIIQGGESGFGARPYHIPWARSINEQGRKGARPVFNKQLGACPTVEDTEQAQEFVALGARVKPGPALPNRYSGFRSVQIILDDKAGRDPAQWPEDLRRREFPEVRHA
jgi:hypothetical protein